MSQKVKQTMGHAKILHREIITMQKDLEDRQSQSEETKDRKGGVRWKLEKSDCTIASVYDIYLYSLW